MRTAKLDQLDSLHTGRKDPGLSGIPERFGRGDLSVCPHQGFAGAQEQTYFQLKECPQGSPQGQTLGAPLLRGTSVLH